jgi:hypothetical protein
MIEGSGSGSIPLTNGFGSGSRNTGMYTVRTYTAKSAQNDTNAAILWKLSSYYIIFTALCLLATSRRATNLAAHPLEIL